MFNNQAVSNTIFAISLIIVIVVAVGASVTATSMLGIAPKGDTGAIGPQGSVGPQGPKGDTGATGAQGPIGATGPQGQTGPQGAMGPMGATGPTGAQGIQGTQGAVGPSGANGSMWYSGSVAPSSGTGVNGDFYLNVASGDVYNKTNGVWIMAGNLRGPAGATGPNSNSNSNSNTTTTSNVDLTLQPSNIGISLHSLNSTDAKLVRNSSATWVRIDVNNSFYNEVVAAHSSGLKVLGILDSWMFNQSSKFTITDWQGNVTNYVKQNPTVEAWEIWNEPANPTYPLLNLNITAPNSQANLTKIAQFYYNMSEIAYPIIKENDPNATVLLMGGLNLYSGGDPHLRLDEEFANLTASMGIAQYGDAISVHAYPWESSEVKQSIWDNYSNALNYYRSNFTNKPIWVTETGQQLSLDSSNHIIANEETISAQYMASAFPYFQNQNVSYVFWYSLWDNPWEVNININETAHSYFGLLNSDGTPRPTYSELQLLTTLSIASKADQYLVSIYNPILQLIPNTNGTGSPTDTTYWITSDNLLATFALKNYNSNVSNSIKNNIISCAINYGLPRDANGIPTDFKHETIIGDNLTQKFATNNDYSIVNGSGYTIKAEVDNGTAMIDWQNYSDLVAYQGIAYYNQGDMQGAKTEYSLMMKMWNGYGFIDKAYDNNTGIYQTYKIALAILLARDCGVCPDPQMLSILEIMQDINGGIHTAYTYVNSTTIVGSANVETTALVAIALNITK